MSLRIVGLLVLASAPSCAARLQEPKVAPLAIFERVTALDRCIWAIHEDRSGTHWFASAGSGVYRFDGASLSRLTRASGLCSDDIRSIQEDGAGHLYFGSHDGVSKFDGRSLVTLEASADDAPGVGWKLTPDDLWFSAGQDTGAVLRYDGEKLHRLKIPPTPLGEEFLAKYPRAEYPNMKYSPYDVYTTYRDRQGNLWFGTASLGACRYDGRSAAWIHEQDLGFDLGNRSFGVRAIAEDRDGKFWLTHTRHRYTVDPSGEAQQSRGGLRYARERGLPHGVERGAEDYSYVMSMLRDEGGDLWMATYGAGVWRFDGERLTHYPVEVGGVPITVFSIYRDRGGDLWLGTHEHGVCRFDGTKFGKVSFESLPTARRSSRSRRVGFSARPLVARRPGAPPPPRGPSRIASRSCAADPTQRSSCRSPFPCDRALRASRERRSPRRWGRSSRSRPSGWRGGDHPRA
ncbi:MAG: hypothetical protein IPN34_19205 [Planctomycetes bacterium]|nr:hypothetical protein [Planctomycetota bacterium]